ncbi:MAG: lysophospholipid acyltransferase family protein [Candidatus Binatia bacterium]
MQVRGTTSDSVSAHRHSEPVGYNPAFHARVRPIAEFFYRRYWRVQTDGLENVPGSGAALLVSNHSGGIPFDAVMIGTAIDLEHPQHRLVRFLYDRFVAAMPLVGEFYNRLGSRVASFQNARELLEAGALVGIFPEGVAGVAKGIWESYRLQTFHSGFVRLSLLLRVPIIPVAVVGAEEIYPVIGKWQRLGPLKDLLQVPYVPVTPLFPILGPLGMIPLPTKWHIRFGAPIRFYDSQRLPRRPQPKTIRGLAERVRRRVQAMTHQLLAERESIF